MRMSNQERMNLCMTTENYDAVRGAFLSCVYQYMKTDTDTKDRPDRVFASFLVILLELIRPEELSLWFEQLSSDTMKPPIETLELSSKWVKAWADVSEPS